LKQKGEGVRDYFHFIFFISRKAYELKTPASFFKNVTGCWSMSRQLFLKARRTFSGYSPMVSSHSPMNFIY